MKVLLDENLPIRLRHFLPGHDVATVAYLQWKGTRNGALLAKAAQHGFEAMITMDSSIGFQHNRVELPLSVVILRAPTNQFESIRPLLPDLRRALIQLQPRTLVEVAAIR